MSKEFNTVKDVIVTPQKEQKFLYGEDQYLGEIFDNLKNLWGATISEPNFL